MCLESADTIVTWSESQHSPGATVALRRAREEHFRRQNSATPDSVRNSIERTGIFKDTGIKNSSRRHSDMREAANKGSYGIGEKHVISTVGGLAETSRQSPSLSTDCATDFHEIDRPPSGQQQNYLPQPPICIQKKTEETTLKRRSLDAIEYRDDGRRRIVVEYYDPNRGWYREEDSKSPFKSPKHPSEPAAEPMPAPLTRQQMARNARIKRPSTTLPVIREASDESRENSPSSISGISGKEIRRTESAPVESSSVKGDISGQIPKHRVNSSERKEKIIREPPVPEPTGLPTDTQFKRNQHSRLDRQVESTSIISRDAISRNEMADERERQTGTSHFSDRTKTPLKTTNPCINTSREYIQFSTQPPFNREFRNSHEPLRQHIASAPRSPLIRPPSLYVQQLEYEQEQEQKQNQDRIASGLFNESVEDYEEIEAQRFHFNTETCEENWDDVETEQEVPYAVQDALENRRYIGNLGELGPSEANVYEDSMLGHEATGLRCESSGLDFQANSYLPQDARGDEFNHWDNGDHYFQEPWNENQQDLRQRYEMDYCGNQLARPSFSRNLELDEGQDGNASETISRHRFWRPNPQY